MRESNRKKVMTDPVSGKRVLYTETNREYVEGDDHTERILRRGHDMAKALPKHSLGHLDLGWLFIKGSSIERQKTMDVEAVSVSSFSDHCTFEAAIALLKIAETKIYQAFGKELPKVRSDLKDTNA